jgi:hypothetical protein
MALESSAISVRNSRILSGGGSSLTRGRRHEPLPLFDVENEIGLRSHQAPRRRRSVEISRDQLLDFGRLQPDVAPESGDVAIEQNQIAVHRSLRAKVIGSDA